MSIRIRCPGCKAEYAIADELAGKKVRCKKCDGVIAVKAAPEADAPVGPIPSWMKEGSPKKAAPKADAPPVKRPPPVAIRVEPPRREKERSLPVRQSDRPRRRRDEDARPIRKTGGMALWFVLGGVGAAILLVVVCGAVGAYLVFSRTAPSTSPVAVISPTLTAIDKPAAQADNGQQAALPAPQAPADASAFHLTDVRKSVVFIRRSTPGQPTALGSGFMVTNGGLIATNRHVVQTEAGPNPATVLYVGVPSAANPDVLDYFKGQVAYSAPTQDTLDFALIKITARPGYQAFRPLPMAAAQLKLGESAAAIGFPLTSVDNPVLSFNKGSISAALVPIEDHSYYQTDAAVNHGNSGGPLVNTNGEVVGIVSRGIENANNTNFSLYLRDTGLPAILNQEQVVRAQSEAGPLDPKQLPASNDLKATHLGSWDITHGEAAEEKGFVLAENRGASYWLTNKEPLPENFQLKIQCYVAAIEPASPIRTQPGFGPPGFRPPMPGLPHFVNMNMLRSLYLRFGTDATGDDVMTMSGTTVHLSAALTQVAESGVVVATQHKGVPTDPFVLTVTRRGDELKVEINDEVRMTHKLKSALQGSHKFSIGGFQSILLLRAALVAPVEGPPVPAPVAVVPQKPAPTGPPPGLSFDAGWDKPVDPDGDSNIAVKKESLTMDVPAKRHDLTGELAAMNAPRLLRDVTGDFTAQVRVSGDFKPAGPTTSPGGLPFVGAGLVALGADGSYVRLECAAIDRNGTTDPYISWETRANGRQQGSISIKRLAADKKVYLRLRRLGDEFFGASSRDGTTWTNLPMQEVKLPPGVKIGIAAVTTSSGAFKPQFEEFRLGDSGEAPVAPPPPPVDAKIWAAKPPADWKGPKWLADVAKAKMPITPVTGWVLGAEFKPEEANFTPNAGSLTLQQGKPFETGASLTLQMGFVARTLAELEGKTINVDGKQQPGVGLIFARLDRTPEGQKLPKMETFMEYHMKLEIGKGEGLKLPCKIYICFPDESKSVIAGKFMLESK